MNTETTVVAALRKFEDNPIKTTFIGSLLAILIFGWGVIRPSVVEDLKADFATKDDISKQLTAIQEDIDYNSLAIRSLSDRMEMNAAYAMERGFKADLNRHMEHQPDPLTQSWRDEHQDIKDQLELATDYKQCLLNNRENCDYLREQLYR